MQSHGDHRIAMAAAVAGLAATGETIVEGTDAIATSYPGFEADLAVVADRRAVCVRAVAGRSGAGAGRLIACWS